MPLTAAELRRVAAAAADGMRRAEQELNAADGRLGDGDTGVTLRRVFDKVAEAAKGAPDDIGGFFRAVGLAGAGATGSSLGTLLAVSLLGIGKANAGKTSLAWGDVGALLASARETMIARGGAALGDKTVLDAVDAVARAVGGLETPEQVRAQAVAAARQALADFRPRRCRIGRARMFAEKSVGLDDPGMLAFARLVEAVAGETG